MGKGSRREREAAAIYQRAGYATYRPATVQYGENDIFGLFDLLAVIPDCEHVRAVQVKSNRASGIEAFTRQTWLWRRLGWMTEYAVPVDNEGWRLLHCTDSGHQCVYDGRENDENMGDGLAAFLAP
jgi:hypothetical protein